MNIERIKNCVGKGAFADAENAWMAGVADTPSAKLVNEALAAFVKADKGEMAETLGWALLEAHASAPKTDTLELATAALLAVPQSEELRKQTAELFKEVHGEVDNFDDIYKAAGLETGQSPRRAIRTLKTCLAIVADTFMANRFDGRVIHIKNSDLNPLGEFEFHDFEEKSDDTLEPKALADEFDILDESDFRVVQWKYPDDVEKMVQKEVGRILASLCLANGGEINSDQIKDKLIPKFLPQTKWTSWWGRARTAAKKSESLTLEGRNPVMVTYHHGGRSLEEEVLASEEFKSAYHPIDYLGVLRNYIREASSRKLQPQPELTEKMTLGIAERTAKCIPALLGEALEGTLVLGLAEKMGLALPEQANNLPAPAEILRKIKDPAAAVAALPDTDLWPDAIIAIRELADAADVFENLLYLAPMDQLDSISANLSELSRPEAIGQAVAKALITPIMNIDLCIWIWLAKEGLLPNQPGKLSILLKLLDLTRDIDHNWHGDGPSRKDARQKIRSALSARSYAIYETALSEADESMGSVVKNKIERTDGLALAVSEQMINRLREKFFSLFVKAKAAPWEDQTVIWTTEKAFEQHQEDLKTLKEVTMPANAKQIGEAAEEGDLRENADWQAAIEERDMLVARARKIQDELARSRVIHVTDIPKDHVGVGSRVTLQRVSDNVKFELSFLGPWDSDTDNKIYAYTSRLAQNMMGKTPGQTITMELDGQEAQFVIDSIAPGV